MNVYVYDIALICDLCIYSVEVLNLFTLILENLSESASFHKLRRTLSN